MDCNGFVLSTFTLNSRTLPLIPVTFKEITLTGLLDSGSSLNIITKESLSLLGKRKIEKCLVPVYTVTGQSVPLTEYVKLGFFLGNEYCESTFHIYSGTMSKDFQIILGNPFLKNKHCSINYCGEDIKINFPPSSARRSEIGVNVLRSPDYADIGCLKHKIELSPYSKRVVNLCAGKRRILPNEGCYLIEPLPSLKSKEILVSRSIVSAENGFYVILANFSDKSIHLNKKMKIVSITPITGSSEIGTHSTNFIGSKGTEDDSIGNFDHSDLVWDTSFDLNHLDPDLRVTVAKFLEDNKDVFASSVLDLPGSDTLPHFIKLKDEKPVRCSPYRVPHHLKGEMESQLDTLLEAGILVPSMSEFSSPVLLVKKACGQYRLAVDFRKLNKQLVKDAYPIPHIAEAVDSLSGSKYFSTLDLTSGFFQQKIWPPDQHKTAITTHKGLFEFTRSPFGLSSSPNNFQRMMHIIFGNLSDLGILVYLDDIIVSSCDTESHLVKLREVFNLLRQHNLKLKPSKCHFLKKKIQYLGFEISSGQSAPINKNIEVIKNFAVPNSRKSLRSFLGAANFYRKYLPNFSKRTKTLTDLTKEKLKFKWNEQAQREFEDIKNALVSKPCLALPDFNKTFLLYTDASGGALGAVLAQLNENNFPQPVAFASRKLKDAESRYSATERELLALVWATSHFKCYLANKHFKIYTDHAALTYVLKIKDATSRMAKWICLLSDFDFETKFIAGKCNGVADFLSRHIEYPLEENHACYTLGQEECNSFIPMDQLLADIRNHQKTDKKCIDIAKKIEDGLTISPSYLKFFFDNDILVCTDSRDRPSLNQVQKLVVPKAMVPEVFRLTHDLETSCHQGYKKTIGRIRSYFYWPGMTSHVRNLVASCRSCQEKRAHMKNQLAPLQRIPIAEQPMRRIHVDIQGPLPVTFSGNRYIISYIDAFSKWIEAYPLQSTTSDIIADTLADFISRHGIPSVLITDQGSNFMSEPITKLYKRLGIKHIFTTPYHPEGNGASEKSHDTLLNALSHIVHSNQTDWDTKLKFALLSMRTSLHSATQFTPSSVIYGRDLNLPYSLFTQTQVKNYCDEPTYCETLIPLLQNMYSEVRENLRIAAERQECFRAKTARVKDIEVGDRVYLFTPAVGTHKTKKLAKLNTGPYVVMKKINQVNYKIALEQDKGKEKIVHVNRLTKCYDRLPEFRGHEESNNARQQETKTNVPSHSLTKEDDAYYSPPKRNRIFLFPPETVSHPVPASKIGESGPSDVSTLPADQNHEVATTEGDRPSQLRVKEKSAERILRSSSTSSGTEILSLSEGEIGKVGDNPLDTEKELNKTQYRYSLRSRVIKY